MDDATIYRTDFRVTVLSRGRYDVDNLDGIAYDIAEGDCVGDIVRLDSRRVHPADVHDELCAVGNDGSFFDDDTVAARAFYAAGALRFDLDGDVTLFSTMTPAQLAAALAATACDDPVGEIAVGSETGRIERLGAVEEVMFVVFASGTTAELARVDHSGTAAA